MTPYILTFIVSLFFIKKSCTADKKKFYYMSFLALLPPILLAGFRDITIGTDVKFYVKPVFDNAVSWASSPQDLINRHPEQEPLYHYLNFICGKICANFSFFLCVIQTIIILPALCCAHLLRKYLSPVFFMYIFYMLFYNESLNMVRQSMAISLSLLGFGLFFTHKRNLSAIIYLFSLLCHNTAIICIILLIIMYLHERFSYTMLKRFFYIISILCVILIVKFDNIMQYMINIGWLNIRYEAYLSEGAIAVGRLNKSSLVLEIIVFIYFLLIYKLNRANRLLLTFGIITFITILFDLTGYIVLYLRRFSMYTLAINCVSIPYTFKMIKMKRITRVKTFSKNVFYFLFAFYWVYSFIVSNNGETIPYTSKILGIY